MIRNRILLKSFAVFFVFELVLSTIVPTLSWALTSGPTSPEHTSFEPVDVTDMVNVGTGDFVYNMPLFEVPGPSGGYPISLSYHAGIQPDVDASWVGLGFTLNPGAINRTVDGTPDDYAGSVNSQRTFWEGGRSSAAYAGVSLGNGAVTAGLSYSSDTYRGMSVGANLGFAKGQANFGLNYTTDPFGNGKFKPSAALKTSQQVSYEKIEGAYSTISGVSSIKTAGQAFASNIGIGGYRGAMSLDFSKQGNIRTKGFDVKADIPISQSISIQLAARYKRYWIDERNSSIMYGSINLPSEKPVYSAIRYHNYDVTDLYYLEDTGPTTSKIADNPSKGIAGTFLTYDSYSVTGQGIGGSIRPYNFNTFLYRPTLLDGDNKVIVQPYPLAGNRKPGFRFVNDFSNSYLYAQDDFAVDVNNPNPLSFQFKTAKEITGDGSSLNGYVDGELAGSRSIKYYSKSENFSSGASDYVKSTSLGYTNKATVSNHSTGAFKIKNESGVTYHYALPVYSYDEHTYTGSVDWRGKHLFNQYKRADPYAYAWLLTAMTGPDYVDVNNDGKANTGDFGYWITFEYGKWSDAYNWRNPAKGMMKDVDHINDFFSKGKKEVYYLNAIKSPTHTALFIKELRRDGKGVVHEIEPAVKINSSNETVEKIDQGGFEPVGSGSDKRVSTSTLRLKEIILLKNSDLNYTTQELAERSTTYSHTIGANNFHMGANVIDVHDIQSIRDELLNKSLRSVAFDHNYSLAPHTTNSFISDLDKFNSSDSHLASTENGKLKLKSVQIKGKRGAIALPPVRFEYETEAEKMICSANVTFVGSYSQEDPAEVKKFVVNFSTSPEMVVGDIVKLWKQNDELMYAVVLSNTGNTVTFRTIWGIPNLNGVFKAFQKTKNPPYAFEKFDIWGFYKSDYVDYGHENISRLPSDISAKSTDVWSLRQIKTATGSNINIDYESDTYNNSIKQVSSLVIKKVEVHNQAQRLIKVFLHGSNARKAFVPGSNVKIQGVTRRKFISSPELLKCDCNGTINNVFFWQRYVPIYTPVIEVGDNYIIVEDATLVSRLTAAPRDAWVDCSTYTEQPNGGGNNRPYKSIEPHVFTGGEVEFTTNASNLSIGGGLRVREISITQPLLNKKSAVTYEYNQGVTSYEPLGLDVNIPRVPGALQDCLRSKETEVIEDYKSNVTLKVTYKNFVHLLANSRLMPGPGVMYGSVKVQESVKHPDGAVFLNPTYSTYNFEVFNPKLVDVFNNALTSTNLSDNGYKIFSPMAQYGAPKGDPGPSVQGLNVSQVTTATSSIQDFSAVVGTLKSIATYNNEQQKLSEVSYKYLFDEMSSFNFNAYREKIGRYKNQGLIEEVFADAKIVNTYGDNYELFGLLSKYSQFPSIPISSTSINYKTGVKQVSENIAFDFYSGVVTQSLSSDSYGNYFLAESTPAYLKYPVMGLPLATAGGKNMLVQEAESKLYKVHLSLNDPGGGQPPLRTIHKDGILNAAVSTWSNQLPVLKPGELTATTQPGIWRKYRNYTFIGNDNTSLLPDGSYPFASFNAFTAWGSEIDTPGWQKQSEMQLYDVQSHTLEAMDINGNYAATKMSADATQVFAVATNSKYNEFAFSGAEDALINTSYGGGVLKVNGTEVTRTGDTDFTTTHTGQRALKLTSGGQQAFKYSFNTTANKTYHASVWVNSLDGRLFYKLNGITTSTPGQPSQNKMAGAWYLIEMDIPAGNQNGTLEVWCQTETGLVHFDDFRVHPNNASMISYVYDPSGELTHILDNNNLYVEYKYDALGRLTEVYKETFKHSRKQLSETVYHYAIPRN